MSLLASLTAQQQLNVLRMLVAAEERPGFNEVAELMEILGAGLCRAARVLSAVAGTQQGKIANQRLQPHS